MQAGGSSAFPYPSQPAPLPPVPPDTPKPPEVTIPQPWCTGDCAAPPPAPSPFDWTKFRLGGQYRVEADGSNFTYHQTTITNNEDNGFFVNQRFRLWLTYNPTDNVEGYIQMQVGGINWGTDFDYVKNYVGSFDTPDDHVGIQLRRAWLAVKDDDWGKVRVGFLDWHDSFKDTMASSDYDFNIGGIDWVKTFKEYNDFQVQAAILLLTDQAFVLGSDETNPGPHSAYLFAIDLDQPLLDKKSSIGASVYYLDDRGEYSYPTLTYSYSWDLWIGVRGKTEVNNAPLSGFFILNTGDRTDFGSTDFHHTGWAGEFEVGPVPVGCGKFSTRSSPLPAAPLPKRATRASSERWPKPTATTSARRDTGAT